MKSDAPTRTEDGQNKGQKTRSDILNCAARHFVEHGVAGASLQEIAKDVGITRPALYYHFKSKDEVLRALVTESAEQAARELSVVHGAGGPPLDRLERAAVVLVNWILVNPVRFLVADRNDQNLPPSLSERNRGGKRRVLEIFETIVREGIAAGDFRPVNAKIAALSIIAMCTSTARWYSASGTLSKSDIATAVADLAVSSVRRRGPRQQRDGVRAAIQAARQELDYLENHLLPNGKKK